MNQNTISQLKITQPILGNSSQQQPQSQSQTQSLPQIQMPMNPQRHAQNLVQLQMLQSQINPFLLVQPNPLQMLTALSMAQTAQLASQLPFQQLIPQTTSLLDAASFSSLSQISQQKPATTKQEKPSLTMSLTPQASIQANQSNEEWRKLFINNISEDISDSLFQKLLMECGEIVKWKRSKDEKGNFAKFGIVEFKSVECVLRCIRLLHNYQIGESKLEIKSSQSTEQFLSQWKDYKSQEWNLKSDGEKSGLETFDQYLEKNDVEYKHKIEKLQEEINKEVKKNQQEKEKEEEKKEHKRERQRDKDRKSYISDLDRRAQILIDKWVEDELVRNMDKKSKQEKQKEKEKEKQKKKMLQKEMDMDSDTEKRLKTKFTSQDRKKARQQELEEDEFERRKELNALLPPEPQDKIVPEEEEIHEPKQDGDSHQIQFEPINIQLQLQEHSLQHQRELEQQIQKNLQQQKKNDHPYSGASQENPESQPSIVVEPIQQINPSAVKIKFLTTTKPEKAKPEASRIEIFGDEQQDGEETYEEKKKKVNIPSIGQLLFKKNIAAQQAQLNPADPAQQAQNTGQQPNPQLNPQVAVQQTQEVADANLVANPAQTQTQAEPKPLQGQQQQLLSIQQPVVMGIAQPGQQLTPVQQQPEENPSSSQLQNDAGKAAKPLTKQLIEKLVKQIPQKKEDVFNFVINFGLLARFDVLEKKVKPWLLHKSKEYLSEEEPNFAKMILKQLNHQEGPQKILQKVEMILDENSEEFVVKLWRMIIFEQLKLENGLV